MDWIIGILLLAAGIVIGYFVARHQLGKALPAQSSKSIEQNIKQLLAQQSSNHIHESGEIINNIAQQCEALKMQLDDYQALLSSQSDDDDQSFSFFGDQASSYLRNQQKAKRPAIAQTDYQPRDYSAESSGLFAGAKNQQSNADKEQ